MINTTPHTPWFAMLAEITYTPWFPGDVQPARPGWYEVRVDPETNLRGGVHILVGRPFRWWDGRHWMTDNVNHVRSVFGLHAAHQWRGLARDPATIAR